LFIPLLYQWNSEREQILVMEQMSEELIISNLINLGSKLYVTAQTLENYNNNFTEQEKVLFIQSLNKDSQSLSHIGIELSNYLKLQIEGNVLIYEHYIWLINVLLIEIIEGNFSNEDAIQSVAKVMKEQSYSLKDMFFKEHIGSDGLDSKELKRIVESIEKINDEIRKWD
jgi:hypothetical protein